MFETVTVEQLARMLPGASRVDLWRVLELCQSPEGDRALRDLVAACGCLAGAVFCTCGNQPATASAEIVKQLAAVYKSGRVSRSWHRAPAHIVTP